MPISARRLEGITALVVAIAACKGHPAVRRDAPRPADAAPADAAATNRITITIDKPRPPGEGLAKRCTLGGDPITSDCTGGNEGIALDAHGTLYVVGSKEVRRYRRAAGPECRFDPAGAPIALPKVPERAQALDDGPVYLRSGGPAWHVAASGSMVYAFDFFGGLYRIDRGKAEAECTDKFGYDSLAFAGDKVLVMRHGLQALAHCHTARFDRKASGTVYAIGDHVYTSSGDALFRYDGTTRTPFSPATKLCYATSLAACGDGVCVFDGNCPKLVQLAADGTPLRTFESDQLFDVRPWTVNQLLTAPDGTLYLLARHRDDAGGKEICEAALYALPPAAFAM